MGANGRVLRWEALLNARDLGGLPAAAGVVARGAIISVGLVAAGTLVAYLVASAFWRLGLRNYTGASA